MSLSLSLCLAVAFGDSVLVLPAMPFLPTLHLRVSWTKTDAKSSKFMPRLLKSSVICVSSVDTPEGKAAIQED